jgi:ankyrin repeat protein
MQNWSVLQFAAAKGKLAACRLLVERGAEVYTNPMNTYPPVMEAAWNKHQAVVDYFLQEIRKRRTGPTAWG